MTPLTKFERNRSTFENDLYCGDAVPLHPCKNNVKFRILQSFEQVNFFLNANAYNFQKKKKMKLDAFGII